MRRVRLATVRVQRNRYFADARVVELRLDDHFSGELHPGAALIKSLIQVLRKTAKTTVNIVNRRLKPPACQECEHRIAPPPVQKRHGPWQRTPSSTWQPTALNQLKA